MISAVSFALTIVLCVIFTDAVDGMSSFNRRAVKLACLRPKSVSLRSPSAAASVSGVSSVAWPCRTSQYTFVGAADAATADAPAKDDALAGWASATDEASGKAYYFHRESGRTSWEWPPV